MWLQGLSYISSANSLFMVMLPLGHFYGEFRTNLALIRKIKRYRYQPSNYFTNKSNISALEDQSE